MSSVNNISYVNNMSYVSYMNNVGYMSIFMNRLKSLEIARNDVEGYEKGYKDGKSKF